MAFSCCYTQARTSESNLAVTKTEINIVKADLEEKVTLTEKVQLRAYLKHLF